MEGDPEVRSLRRIVTAQGVAIVALILWLAYERLVLYIDRSRSSLTVESQGEDLRIKTTSDGPFVITHLMATGYSDSDTRVAALPQPLACIDSGGLIIPKVADLDWRDTRGEVASPPSSSTLQALILRPEMIGAGSR